VQDAKIFVSTKAMDVYKLAYNYADVRGYDHRVRDCGYDHRGYGHGHDHDVHDCDHDVRGHGCDHDVQGRYGRDLPDEHDHHGDCDHDDRGYYGRGHVFHD
jgi:hypothetical protein